jgi:formate C-acetyltransferase
LNYTPYEDDASFLRRGDRGRRTVGQADDAVRRGAQEGRARHFADSGSITAHAPGYIDRDNEIIVGLQTEAPLKRAIMPNGGLRMVLSALEAYGYNADPHVVEGSQVPQDAQRRRVRRLHADMPANAAARICSRALPDAYGRGRIIGDYGAWRSTAWTG